MTISPKWSNFAERLLGDKDGKHCHWCKYMKSEDGEVTCTNPKSEFCDGDRIRTWDGLYCAEKCGSFELNEWYTKDENFDTFFRGEA